ncbi:hypothetical protein D5W64_13355 [Salmonella enterica subsp. enterica serovar Saintpaul]|nr:hypothetical protein [Salmonella enterica subsp. enterica serovar Saintpaul]
MIVSKSNMTTLCNKLTIGMINSGIESGWLGDYKAEVFIDNDSVAFDISPRNVGTVGVELTISYKRKTIGIIKVKDLIMFSRACKADEVQTWMEQTQEYLRIQLGKFFAEKYVTDNGNVHAFLKDTATKHTGGQLIISGITFKALVNGNTAWFVIKSGRVELLHIERSNFIGMTTKQGWQAMNIANITAEFRRSLLALIEKNDNFKFGLVM